MFNVGASQFSGGGEMDSDEFAEPGRVVVSDGFRIAESLQHRVRHDDLIFDVCLWDMFFG